MYFTIGYVCLFAVLSSPLITVLMPRRYLWHWLGWLAIPSVLMVLDTYNTHWSDKNFGYLIEIFLLEVAGGATLFIALVKIGWWHCRDRKRGKLDIKAVPNVMRKCLAISWGAVLAVLIFLLLRHGLQGTRSAYEVHVSALMVCGVLWGGALLTYRAEGQYPVVWGKFFACGASVAFSLLLLMSVVYGYYVRAEAEKIAGNAPYCIQTSGKQVEYMSAETLLDLSALAMSAHTFRSFAHQFHAVLAVDGKDGIKQYNWSYKRNGFQPTGGQFVYCLRDKDFSRKLSLFASPQKAKNDQGHFVSFVGQDFIIPYKYSPRASSSNASLTLSVGAMKDKSNLCCIQSESVTIKFRSKGERVDISDYMDEKIIETSEEHGLSKVVWAADSISGARYMHGEKDNTADVLIRCDKDFCFHSFVSDGRIISLNYSPKYLDQWRKKQDNIIALLDSFQR